MRAAPSGAQGLQQAERTLQARAERMQECVHTSPESSQRVYSFFWGLQSESRLSTSFREGLVSAPWQILVPAAKVVTHVFKGN